MTKASKVLLGALSLWPPIYILIFMGVAFYSIFSRGTEPSGIWAIIVPLHLLTILLTIGLLVFYMVNVFRNERVSKDMKVLWAVVLFMGAMMAMPIYWYLYIWRDPPSAAVAAEPGILVEGRASMDLKGSSSVGRTTEYVPPPEPPDWR